MLETDHFASGQEKREILEGEDYDVTDYEEFTKQAWGTADVPVKVPSKYGKRIVGCIGEFFMLISSQNFFAAICNQ